MGRLQDHRKSRNGVARAEFTGSADLVRFTDDESASGATFLVDSGLIKTMNTMQSPHSLVWVTELGIERCDSGLGIPDFISHRRGGGSVKNTFYMGGSGNVFSNAIGENSTANAVVNMGEADALRQIAQAIREVQPLINLSSEQVEGALLDIEATDDPTRVERGLRALYAQLANVSTGATGGLISAYIAARYGIG